MSLLIVRSRDDGIEGGVVEDGRLLDYLPADEGGLGAVHLGRVRRVDRDLKAALVDLGPAGEGWLDLRQGGPAPLHEGASVIVQITRTAIGDKGPRVTTDIVLADPEREWRPLRSAEDAPEPGRLQVRWRSIERRAASLAAPALLDAPDPVGRVLRAGFERGATAVLADDHLALLKVRRVLGPDGAGRPLELEPGAWAGRGLGEQLEDALARAVALPEGGTLLIEATSALTVIDVNGAGRHALDLDLAAVPEIARQLRLRRIGGIIVVDFVDLARRRDRERLHLALAQAVQRDPVPVQVLPMTRLGLVQMTRKRVGPSLDQLMRRPCPTCAGEGRVQGARAPEPVGSRA